jgi:hypothetical protein
VAGFVLLQAKYDRDIGIAGGGVMAELRRRIAPLPNRRYGGSGQEWVAIHDCNRFDLSRFV